MSLAEIESELEKLAPDELRRLALKSWSAFLEREGGRGAENLCDEDDPRLLAALDEAVQRADSTPARGHSGQQVRTRIGEWTAK